MVSSFPVTSGSGGGSGKGVVRWWQAVADGGNWCKQWHSVEVVEVVEAVVRLTSALLMLFYISYS